MEQATKHKFIALFLLIVFSMNTLAGFACSIGVDMGYNGKHHEHSSGVQEKEHEYSAHHTAPVQELASDKILKSTSDDCCAGQVTKFIHLDKSVVQNNLLLKAPVLTIFLVTNSFGGDIKDPGFSIGANLNHLRRSWHFNHTDIRTAIQSFQI